MPLSPTDRPGLRDAVTSPLRDAMARCLSSPTGGWLHSVHVVNFDVDVGHVLEWSGGSGVLSTSEASALCFAAMPDSQPSSGGLGDRCFTFRLVVQDKLLWGFSLFRAHRMAGVRRGCFQKAMVLLTALPLFRLFRSTVSLLADAYFGAGGSEALREALHQCEKWPQLRGAGVQSLPLLGSTLTLDCIECASGPSYAYQRQPTVGGGAALREVRDASALCALGGACWTLWQLVLTGESLVVLTPSPQQCGSIVLALPALVEPLSCMAELRPYMTIHAPEWDALLSGSGPPPGSGVVLGATNPLLARAPPPWLSLLTLAEAATSADGGGGSGSGGSGGGSGGGGSGGLSFLFGLRRGSRDDADESGGGGSGGGGSSICTLPSEDGGGAMVVDMSWTLACEQLVRPDERVLRRLRGEPPPSEGAAAGSSSGGAGGGRGAAGGGGAPSGGGLSSGGGAPSGGGAAGLSGDASQRGGERGEGSWHPGQPAEALLREHFAQLTTSFLQPLERFLLMGSLEMRTPSPAGTETGREAMMLHEWSYEAQTRFLRELEKMEPPPLPRSIVPQRADLVRLYAAFLRTPSFARWFELRRQRASAAFCE